MIKGMKSIFLGCLFGWTALYGYSKNPEEQKLKVEECVKRWEQLRAIAENSTPVTLSAAIRELITEITEPYIGEEEIKKICEVEKSTLEGEYVEYWENGKLKIRGAFKEGLAEGHIHGWYPDGSDAFKGFFSKGIKQGIHMAFFPNKKMKGDPTKYARLLTYSRKGQANGAQETSYPTGRMQVYSKYKNGSISEEPVTFWDNGLLEERFYKEGKLIHTDYGPKHKRNQK